MQCTNWRQGEGCTHYGVYFCWQPCSAVISTCDLPFCCRPAAVCTAGSTVASRHSVVDMWLTACPPVDVPLPHLIPQVAAVLSQASAVLHLRGRLACRGWEAQEEEDSTHISCGSRRNEADQTKQLQQAFTPALKTLPKWCQRQRQRQRGGQNVPGAHSPALARPANTKPLDLSIDATRCRTLSRSSMANGWKESSPKSSITCQGAAHSAGAYF
jgi:hypothetical protein